jgi:hypothetical protein
LGCCARGSLIYDFLTGEKMSVTTSMYFVPEDLYENYLQKNAQNELFDLLIESKSSFPGTYFGTDLFDAYKSVDLLGDEYNFLPIDFGSQEISYKNFGVWIRDPSDVAMILHDFTIHFAKIHGYTGEVHPSHEENESAGVNGVLGEYLKKHFDLYYSGWYGETYQLDRESLLKAFDLLWFKIQDKYEKLSQKDKNYFCSNFYGTQRDSSLGEVRAFYDTYCEFLLFLEKNVNWLKQDSYIAGRSYFLALMQ